MKKHIKQMKRGFTLIELLVVITIIGLLAGLAAPAIINAQKTAQQMADVNNVKQLGTILFSDANENNGVYRTNDNPVSLINDLIADGVLTEVKIIGGFGATKMSDTNALAANIAWSYTTNLTTADNGGLPLLASRGTKTIFNGSKLILDVSDSSWKNIGSAVYFLNSSAEFKKVKGTATTVTNQLLGNYVTNYLVKPQ